MYGSDWPLVSMGPYIKLLDNLDLSDSVKEHIAWQTAVELFKIPLPEK
jgi:predicted TIM-barrel fold metal-dependent hydrolase